MPNNMTLLLGTLVVVVVIILALIALAFWRILRTRRLIHEASREGRRVSAQTTGNPVTSFSRDGAPSDPINVKLIGSAGQIGAAFAEAGWYRADEIDFVTSVRISVDSIFARKYTTAPVSNLYLFGRREDIAFERPGKSVRERDHVRLWNTGASDADGRSAWVGGATHDIKVEISPVTHLPTHKISPDVDAEREALLDSIIETGWVIDEGWEANFGKQTEQRNSLGDTYFTDGRRAVLTLADIFVFAPVTSQVRGRWGVRLAQALSGLIRRRLPDEGLRRAEKHRAERQAREQAKQANEAQPASPGS
ncbi:MAG TPA: LssY C-terminal domain-containing protein [Ktedonobacterales bacterium]|nr:LssY C-terminal domain-containing protein [Ktedonobacterales bacterium]